MQTINKDQYRARCALQRELDRTFPNGVLCAILPIDAGRVQAAGRVEATGRLFCSGIRRPNDSDRWEYELLIDTRRSAGRPAEEVRIWVTEPEPHPTVSGLWEASVSGDDGHLLRLNAGAPPRLMPSAAARRAVSEAHESELFPEGIES